MIYGHGDDAFRFKKIKLNFSSNVSPFGVSESLQKHLALQLSKLDSYPEPLAQNLARAIGEKKNIPAENILIVQGATEAFYLLASLFYGKRSLIYTPSFSEYEDACCMHNHELEFISNAQFPSSKHAKFDLVWLCNPNNPDGKIFDKTLLVDEIKRNCRTLFIIDEAYADFINTNISLENEATQLSNVIIIKSLTKRFAIPALRLGYMVCSIKLMQQLQAKLMPWRINSLALEAGMFCLSESFHDEFKLPDLLNESKRFQEAINQIKGFSVLPSSSSFFLVKATIIANELKTKLAEKHSILIRDASNFRGLTPQHFRLATQMPHENDELIHILKSWNQ
ncbi:MAG: aminotransferase class I/II-fold pyridoxal phosphate-dependent enzyme [Mangrovibacterium sp.]